MNGGYSYMFFKRLSLAIFLLLPLFAFPLTAGAHSHFQSSTPGENEEVNEPVTEIHVTFDGGIGTADMTITNTDTDEEAAIESIDVDNTSMTAILQEPLSNGAYTVEWQNIGDDGHSLDGSFSFQVNAEEETTPEDESTAEENAANENEVKQDRDHEASGPEEEETNTAGTSVLWLSIIIAGLFIVALVIFTVSRKRKS
ncbi:hypothetical protein CHH78_09005 [Shouchella clausii]|uniref:CopC domain-containing protein n=2 Tax=Shouchella clausii TaxID=79880 RepID=A0A268RZW7_SHOCL|nr:hypothetical protein BC8716_15810 [Shouchella clausii]PAD44783.1 hypothetical protein CHH54_00035 [Bacillus sp. 7520-S]PAD09146.1 hypothetical protein CHH76_10550 [Shouchella clausii]PAD11367.1 hypothetical protein CHH74_21280 [Shouchella clausii]PAE83463.1 hypothetical protein CHH78_09005 [Shouchella clausii]